MKSEKISDAFNFIDDDIIEEVEKVRHNKKVKRRSLLKWGALAACLVLAVSVTISVFYGPKGRIELSDASNNVSVTYTNKIPGISARFDLVPMTEEELFSIVDTIFKGTVTKIDNIEMNFNGEKEYRAIAEIKVEKSYRGSCQKSDTISVLLPCPFIEGYWVEDTETVSAMKVGMRGIFMLKQYDDTFYEERNGARLALRDIADYGFYDGSRYAFLETEKGLIFTKWAYESIADATTLEQIEEYVLRMID